MSMMEELMLVLQVLKQVQNLRLDGHVQRGSRLVGDDELGRAGQGHGDHDALAHTAGQLVGIHRVDAFLVGDATSSSISSVRFLTSSLVISGWCRRVTSST